MFSPMGYVSLVELKSRIPENVAKVYFDDIVEMSNDIDKRAPRLAPFLQNTTLADFLEILLLRSVCEHTFVASPSGVLQKLYLKPFFDAHSYAGFQVGTDEGLDIEKLPRNFIDAYQLKSLPTDVIASKYNSVRPDLKKFVTSHGLLNYHRRIPIFYERMAFSISMQAYDWVNQNNSQQAKFYAHAAQLFRPFEGWAICVTEDYARSGWLEYMQTERMGIISPILFQDNNRNYGGRPATAREAAATAYRELFPEGHGTVAWKEVLRKVIAKTGVELSRDTLKRAIGNRESD